MSFCSLFLELLPPPPPPLAVAGGSLSERRPLAGACMLMTAAWILIQFACPHARDGPVAGSGRRRLTSAPAARHSLDSL